MDLKGLVEAAVSEANPRRKTQQQLADDIGVSQGTINNVLSSRKIKKLMTLEKFAKYFKIDPAVLIFPENQTVTPDPVTLSLSVRPATIKTLPPIPVISLANGGPDGFYDDFGYPVGHGFTSVARPVDVKDENAYGVEVRGESMVPRFEEKDIVVVSPKTSVVSGDYVVLKTSDGEVMVKRIRFTNGMIVLESLNPTFDPIFKKKEEVLFYHKIVWTKHG